VVGKENIENICLSSTSDLSFIKKEDVVVLRSIDRDLTKYLLEAKKKIGFNSIIEDFETINICYDKGGIKENLSSNLIDVPKTYKLEEVEEGKTYFVKPYYGLDSNLVDLRSVCKSSRDVLNKCLDIRNRGERAIIEEYIEGKEYTCSLIRKGESFKAYLMNIEVENEYGIQTSDVKKFMKGISNTSISYCSRATDKNLEDIAIKVANAIGVKYYARVDFRVNKKGTPYVIDVNIFPGLGLCSHMYRSVMLQENKSYKDFFYEILETAD
jgi:D-alanine-D-alanine ligase-like ATP-grasp enzyme